MMADSVETETTMSLPIRSSSPSPSIPATPAISSCPSPDRTFSTISSLSFSSAASADARSSVSISTRRRGYIRPQGAEFAESARNRESVMSLGSIAHLQYYFARTGLLDGKGGHAREYKKKTKPENVPRLILTPNAQFFTEADTDAQDPEHEQTNDLTESPTEGLLDLTADDGFDETDEVMLPPTVSTYSIKTHYIPPPPDLTALRKDLLDALGQAEQDLRNLESERHVQPTAPPTRPSRPSLSPDDIPDTDDDTSRHSSSSSPSGASTPQGWHEIQGVRILDVVTLAIRAARIYYTAHERPDRLAAIKSERRIRQELFNVLEVLKRWAGRNFAGGLRDDEKVSITNWMADVRSMLSAETRLEQTEAQERDGWTWARGDDDDWSGREREREAAFLASLMATSTAADSPLPPWTPVDDDVGRPPVLPTPFLARLRDGRDLVRMHNQAVRKSKRLFGEIKAFHEDIAKPYRCAENIRYWLKAAEIRWEVKLDVDVMGVVYGSSDEAWRRFDRALLVWCRTVREELIRDWKLA